MERTGDTVSERRVQFAEGETLALELRGHWYTLTAPVLVLLLTCGVGSFLAATVPDSDARATLRVIIAVTGTALVLRWSVWPFLVWYAHSFLLTTRRLVVREGVMARRGHDVALDGITDASYTRSLLQRMVGCGRLSISVGGRPGVVVLDDVPLVAEVREALAALAADARRATERSAEPGEA